MSGKFVLALQSRQGSFLFVRSSRHPAMIWCCLLSGLFLGAIFGSIQPFPTRRELGAKAPQLRKIAKTEKHCESAPATGPFCEALFPCGAILRFLVCFPKYPGCIIEGSDLCGCLNDMWARVSYNKVCRLWTLLTV